MLWIKSLAQSRKICENRLPARKAISARCRCAGSFSKTASVRSISLPGAACCKSLLFKNIPPHIRDCLHSTLCCICPCGTLPHHLTIFDETLQHFSSLALGSQEIFAGQERRCCCRDCLHFQAIWVGDKKIYRRPFGLKKGKKTSWLSYSPQPQWRSWTAGRIFRHLNQALTKANCTNAESAKRYPTRRHCYQ